MSFQFSIKEHPLKFTFPAGTSRGVLHEKTSFFLQLTAQGRTGIGEAGPLPGLSPENVAELPSVFLRLAAEVSRLSLPANVEEIKALLPKLVPAQYPSVRFALETALLDWLHGGKRVLFDTAFSRGEEAIPINGLIWMGDIGLMRERIHQKLAEGFHCLKLKVGAEDFQQECLLLKEVRQHFSPEQITLRLDANGAFTKNDALRKLEQLSEYAIHSIEQPVKAGQWALMAELCKESPIPIALDEELIGITDGADREALLDTIQPPYIILKPSLLGGLTESADWIARAKSKGMGWWMTSALEANIGLNAIAQYTATYQPNMPQGLGTGQLFENNIPSPLHVREGKLHHERSNSWNLSAIGLP